MKTALTFLTATMFALTFVARADAEIITLFSDPGNAFHAGDENEPSFDNPNPNGSSWSTTFDLSAANDGNDFIITLDHQDVDLIVGGFASQVSVNGTVLGVLMDSIPGWVTGQKIGGAGSLLQETGNTISIVPGMKFGTVITDDIQLNNISLEYSPVPEPSSLALFGIAGIGMVAFGVRRRRRKKA